MTRAHASHSHEREHAPKQKRRLGGNHPLRTRIIAWTVVGIFGFVALTMLVDRRELPARLKDNAYVAKLYQERDAAIAATSAVIDRHEKKAEDPADANADMKQQGYNKDDRAKLEAIITKGGKTE